MHRLTILIAALLLFLAASADAQTGDGTSGSAELQICTSIVDRIPQGTDTVFTTGVDSVFCWSKITGLSGETTVTHVWLHNGNEVARVDLQVRSTSWRTWSQKKLGGRTGNWEVRVVDSAGNTLGATTFVVNQ